MENIVDLIINNFDYGFMFTINILTYIIIKIVDILNGKKNVSVFVKRLILILSIIIIAGIYLIVGYENKIILVNSAIAAPIFWSWILRPIFIKFGMGYKNIDNYLG